MTLPSESQSSIVNLSINKFDPIINYFSSKYHSFDSFVDGGAGLGETSESIIKSCKNSRSKVLAFEPNPANVKAFINRYPDNIVLFPEALGASTDALPFLISNTTVQGSENPFLVEGTSYVGKLIDNSASYSSASIQVPVVKLFDKLMAENFSKVDFMKLDLQGGELNSLIGLGNMLEKTKIIWMEYSGQEGLLEFVQNEGFVPFDTEYLFVGKPNQLIEDLFTISRQGRNSIGKDTFFGKRRHDWKNYIKAFSFMKRHRRLIQTDLMLVNKTFLGECEHFIAMYASALELERPEILSKI